MIDIFLPSAWTADEVFAWCGDRLDWFKRYRPIYSLYRGQHRLTIRIL